MKGIQERADELRAAIENAANALDDLKDELRQWGYSEKDLAGLKVLQKWVLRANTLAGSNSEYLYNTINGGGDERR